MIMDEKDEHVEGGMLIDWDLSKPIPDKSTATRRYARTVSQVSEALYLRVHCPHVCCHQGTWLFMAGDLVRNLDIPQNVEHDIESAFWVVFWIMLSYLQTNLSVGDRSCYLMNTMNPGVFGGTSVSKALFMASPIALDELETPSSPLANLLKDMHNTLGKRYRVSKKDKNSIFVTEGSTQQDNVVQDQHEPILYFLRTVLEDSPWPKDDRASLQEVCLTPYCPPSV